MLYADRRGFTLVELLVVLAIIAVLISLFLPATRNVRDAASRTKCSNNIRQIMFGIHDYESMHPTSGNRESSSDTDIPVGCIGPGNAPEERLSWIVSLLPYIEQQAIYDKIDQNLDYAGNKPQVDRRIEMFLCPHHESDGTVGLTSYYAMAGIGQDAASRPAGHPDNGYMGYDRRTTVSMITDGTSNTIAIMEFSPCFGPWAQGGPSTVRGFDPTVPMSEAFFTHTNGANVGMADGSVRYVKQSVNPMVLATAMTIAGGEELYDW